jgi:hypothetical protein
MKEIFKLNFIPTYGYRSYVAALVGIISSTLMLLAVSIFDIQVLSVEVLDWFLAFFFSIMTFSQEKVESENLRLLKYYSGKTTVIFLIGFTLGLRATELLTQRIISVQTVSVVILGLALYTIMYQILKFLTKNRKIEIIDTSFPDNIKYNQKLSWLVFFLSIITLVLVFLVG